MSIKSILVHIADDEDHLARFKAAKGLAACFDAHLTALYVTSPVHFKAAMVGRGASVGYEREKVAFAERKMKEIENEFREYLDNNDIDLEWVVNDGEHLERLTYHACFNDLAIVSQTEETTLEEIIAHSLPDQLALHSPCPTLVLPHGWDKGGLPERVVIGWKPSPASNRALRGAMPFLKQAKSVRVVTVSEHGKADSHDKSVMMHLERHGIQAELVHETGIDRKAGHILLDQAASYQADMLVMGGFSHSRLHDLVVGSATSHVLHYAEVPLLMAH